MSLRETLLNNIRYHMGRRTVPNMSELARLSKVPQSTLSKFETGVHQSISLQHIDKIAQTLHIDAAQLFAPAQPTLPSPRTEAFMGVMEQLSPQEQSVLVATGNALIESRKKQC